MRPAGSRGPRTSSFLVITLAFANWQVSLALAGVGSALPDAANLQIVVLQGEDGVNIIKKKTAVKPVVEVRDRNNLPVAGATVVFLAPDSGPGVTFADGSRLFTTVTNASGRATVPSMKPVGVGTFKIKATANFDGQSATTAITQTNVIGAVISGTVLAAIIAGVAAAAGVAVAVATGGGAKAPSAETGTIGGSGPPVITPPH